LFEVNEAAAIIHDVAHPDANIIFGNVIDDALGDTVRVTVIAAGFDRSEADAPRQASEGTTRPSSEAPPARGAPRSEAAGPAGSDLLVPRHAASRGRDVFDVGGDDDLDLDDDFDVPSFLR
jgi:cell division protein FtsZ